MTLLDLITKAATNPSTQTPQSKHPIVFNSDDILRNLNPQTDDDSPSDASLIKPLVKPLQGWQIPDSDTQIIEFSNAFCKKLRALKKLKSFGRELLLGILNPFLEKNRATIDLCVNIDSSDSDYTRVMLEKLGSLFTREVVGLLTEIFVRLEFWELLETLIVQKTVVDLTYLTNLIDSLIDKSRSDLICLCIKHFKEIPSSNVQNILKYFLSPPKGACTSMENVRREWESQALIAIDKVAFQKLSDARSQLAKQASILLMIAYDGFSLSELCMHYLFASNNLDELVLTNAISKLDGSEILKLIRYLGKWVSKYEKFPQAGPCPNALFILNLRACKWVPSLESVVRCIGVVVDERFSSLVLSKEFHQEMRSLEQDVKSLAAQSKLCCLVADLVESLKEDSELK